MAFEPLLAVRHLKSRKKTGFVSLIGVISVLGVMVGVMALIVVIGVMSGFSRQLKEKIVGVQPHLRIEKVNGVENPDGDLRKILAEKIPGLKTAAPYVEGQAIIRSKVNATGVIVKGMDPAREDLEIYQQHMVSGFFDLEDLVETVKKRRFFFFRKKVETRTGAILLGESLARRLQVRVGDEVTLISPFQGELQSMFGVRAQTHSFLVRGIFKVGMNDFDTAMVLIHLSQAQGVYHLGSRVTGLSLKFENVDDAEKWKFYLRGMFPPDYYFQTWYDMNRNFFQALKVEKSVMTILLGLILLVAAFNIVATLFMIVMEKTKDIGILRALGATRASIRKIFVLEGFVIGTFGVAFGTSAGLLLLRYRNEVLDFVKRTTGYELFPSDVYLFDGLPAEIHHHEVIAIAMFALAASVLAAFYPAWRASRLNPVEALRYE